MIKRENELDILRLFALIGVIFTHSSNITATSEITGNIMTFLVATITWHVPVFVMISGRFFLDPTRNITAAKLTKAITRLLIAFLFWNMLYQPYKIYAGHYLGLNWKGILSQALLGPYHFWFLYMMICLYAVTPFLRKISQDRKLMEYFIALFLIFEFLTLYGPMLPFIGGTIESIITLSQFHFALGFTGYYILGYYLYRYPLRGRKETILYIMGASMFVFTGLATVWNVRQGAEGAEWFSKYLMPNVAIEASALYIIFTNHISRMTFSQKITLWISRLAEYSFGIYLIHALVLEFLEIIPWDTLPCNPILIVGARVLLVFTISTALTALIRKIPHIGKKIT